MYKVLFFTSDYPENSTGNLYVDLVNEFIKNGNSVDVITPIERKYHRKTSIYSDTLLRVIRVKSLNFRGDVSLIEKGLATLLFSRWYIQILKKYLKGKKYDILICSTLPISYASVMKLFKKKYNGFIYLLHKDFFPQSAIDMKLLKKSSLQYKLFRHIETTLYKATDMIGVMSAKNVKFILQDNLWLSPQKVEVCPNSIIPFEFNIINEMKKERDNIRRKYSIPAETVIYVYGGSISRAQGIEFILSVVDNFDKCLNSFLLFVGDGNEFEYLKLYINAKKPNNVAIFNKLTKPDFDELLAACDVGIVFLDYRFTIANIPARTLAHMNMSQPVLVATDGYTDFKEFVEDNKIGLWSRSNDVDAFILNTNRLSNDLVLRTKMGNNARKLLETQFTTKISYDIIMKHIF